MGTNGLHALARSRVLRGLARLDLHRCFVDCVNPTAGQGVSFITEL
jgi:hypothetical protein